MRQILQQQIPIVHLHVEHEHGFELAAMSHVLDEEPRVTELIFNDLTRHGARTDTGRGAMTAEQVLRAVIVKQMNGFSYKELAFHLADSRSYKTFCRFGINDKPPSKATLQRNIKKVSAETMEAINRILVRRACDGRIERGRKVRVDCTGMETNIHSPSDSSLLWDCVRVLTRNMHLARELVDFSLTDHSRRAKRRYIGIRSAKKKKRVKLYRDLLKVTRETVSKAKEAAEALKNHDGVDVIEMLAAQGLATELEQTVELAHQVISQTERRVLNGESVPADEKIVSIFEPHTDIIKKNRGDPLYGHKLCLAAGASGIITDCVIENGNPADSTLALKMMERQKSLYGIREQLI